MKKVLALVLSLVMVLSLCGTAFADFYTDKDLEDFDLGGYTPNEIRNDAVSRAIALDSYILLKNDGVLPIAKEGKIALFGNGATGTIKGGSGSGIVNQRERDWIDTAFADAGYEITTPQAYFNAVGRGNVATGFSGDREAADVALTDEWLEEAAAADTAIYVLARTAGEGSDRQMSSGNGAWELYAQERGNLEKIAATFENVVIVLNTYVTDITWLNEIDNIDSVLFVGYGGQRTGETTLQVLNGDVTPSGKTISTWAWELDDYLSSQAGFSWMDGNTDTEFYNDGIYVGYRYFDTFGLDDEVAFPFGFGLSYTEFKIDVKDVKIDADEVAVTVSVVNTGDYSGKEVVQVYFSAPDGTLEKPYQELAAFGKTDLLAPGEKQTLVIKFATTDMSSYSEELAAYIMEPGEYYIRVGNSSRNTHIAAAGVVEETIITEQLSNQFALEDGAEEFLNEVSKAGATPITYQGEAAEKKNAPKTVITGIETVNNASPYDDETAVTYLFAADAENYEPRTGIHLVHGNATGVIQNAQNPAGPRFNGHQETTYDEVVEIVPDLPAGFTKDNVKLTDVLQGKITLKQFVACLSLAEMARLVNAEGQGASNVGYIYDEDGNLLSYSHAMPCNMARTTEDYFVSRHIPALGFTDGPAGIRCDNEGGNMSCPQIRQPGDQGGSHYWSTDGGITNPTGVNANTPGAVQYHMYPTAFPGAINVAATWNTDMMYAMGEGVGLECREYNVASWLAPGINIHRNPMCGRNFEYFSEDPLLSGFCGGYITAGVQSSDGVGVCLKHYFGNNQENNRGSENNVMSERTAREIYLMGYKIAIEIGQPMYMMTSYNANNGWYSGDNFDACTDMLRGEWNFNGMVMTDWNGGGSLPRMAVHAGNDMMCPGQNVSTIIDYTGTNDPTWAEDGYVASTVEETWCGSWHWTTVVEDWGSFVPDANGEHLYTVPTNAESEEYLSQNVKNAIANRTAQYDKIGDDGVIYWFGYHNSICLGDVQKAALHILNVMLYSQDMEILCEDLGIERPEQYENFTDNYGGTGIDAANDSVEKSEIENIGIVADKVTVDTAVQSDVKVPVYFTGEKDLTTVRLYIDSALPIAGIESENDYEYNPEDGRIIIYLGDGGIISDDLFSIVYDFDGLVADGVYPVDLEVIEVTGADGFVTDAVAFDGAVIVDNTYEKGDITQDGEITNADLIMLARYLVGLVEFNEKQKIAADFNNDGIINNTDLLLLARFLVEEGNAPTNPEAAGTYKRIIEGYDWGAAETKLVLSLDRKIDAASVDASDFAVTTVRQGASNANRTITDAYVSDADGNKVNTNSKFVTIEMYVSPSVGGVFRYANSLNQWPNTFYDTISLRNGATLTSRNKVIDTLSIDQEATAMVSPLSDQFVQKDFTGADGRTLRYGYWEPAKDNVKNALIIWLHGAGEGGRDTRIVTMGNKVENLITDKMQAAFKKDGASGAYVLVPQSPTVWMDVTGNTTYTSDGSTIYAATLFEVIGSYGKSNPDIDPNRVLIGGCSNGGFMTMKMIIEHPDYFAAAYPICQAYQNSWITDAQIQSIKNIPMWFTQARNDTTVNPNNYTVPTYDRLVAAGAKDVYFSFFDDVHDTTGNWTNNQGQPYQYMGHWSWIYMLNNECVKPDGTTIMEWLAAQSK